MNCGGAGPQWGVLIARKDGLGIPKHNKATCEWGSQENTCRKSNSKAKSGARPISIHETLASSTVSEITFGEDGALMPKTNTSSPLPSESGF